MSEVRGPPSEAQTGPIQKHEEAPAPAQSQKKSLRERLGLHDGARVKKYLREAAAEPKESYATYRLAKKIQPRVKPFVRKAGKRFIEDIRPSAEDVRAAKFVGKAVARRVAREFPHEAAQVRRLVRTGKRITKLLKSRPTKARHERVERIVGGAPVGTYEREIRAAHAKPHKGRTLADEIYEEKFGTKPVQTEPIPTEPKGKRMIKKCVRCGERIQDRIDRWCPNCGYKIVRQKPNKVLPPRHLR